MCFSIPAQIIEIADPNSSMAAVNIGGQRQQVNISMIREPGQANTELLGCWVVVHAGYAVSLLDPAEAESSLRLIAELNGNAG